ncbi:hypothetical protein GYB59_19320 [bacterium]|nr:hypothetical protein [bacterium]
MSGMGSIGGVNAHVSTTEKSSTIRTQVTDKISEKIHGKVDEKLTSAGVSEKTRDALLADVTQLIEQQMSSGGRPDPKAIRESISGIFEKHGISIPDGLQQGSGRMGLLGGYTGNGAVDGSQFDAIQSLIENLQAASTESRNNQSSANQYARYLLDGHMGLDFEA